MKAGSAGGLQYHHMKDEGGYMVEGELLVRFDDGTGCLSSRVCRRGDSFRFPVGAVHQGIALTDCTYIEVSTPYYNDRVHVEKEYGIEEEAGGLPSTKKEEVVESPRRHPGARR